MFLMFYFCFVVVGIVVIFFSLQEGNDDASKIGQEICHVIRSEKLAQVIIEIRKENVTWYEA